MTHVIGRIRRGGGRKSASGSRNFGAMRQALQAGSVQAKLKVGAQNDAYEREADSVASHVMAGHSVDAVSSMADGPTQRKCDECEAEEAQRAPLVQRADAPQEEEEVQMKRSADIQREGAEEEQEEIIQNKALQGDVQRQDDAEVEELQMKSKSDGSFVANASVSAQVAGLKGGGQPLPASARSYFEPRFGADFSDVRVHTGQPAETASRALNARAFTTGRHVVFGKGEYAPHSRQGGELLAHELTHVIQQRGYKQKPTQQDAAGPVQRWSLGAAPVPAFPNGKLVPQGAPKGSADHRKKLNDARTIVANVLKNKNCVNYFKDTCDAGTATSLKDAFNRSRVYFMDAKDTVFGFNFTGTGNIAYNQAAYNQSKWFLASTLLHEMHHVCAPTATNFDAEFNAENAVEKCKIHSPLLHRINPTRGAVGSRVSLTGWGFGPTKGKHDRVELNGVSCPIKSWTFDRAASSVTIVVTIPAGATSGGLRVINNNVKSAPAKFKVT
jgi:hypothetical protein